MNDQIELYHHGVKGMKWGVRKKRASSTKSATKKSKNPRSIFSMKTDGATSVDLLVRSGKQLVAAKLLSKAAFVTTSMLGNNLVPIGVGVPAAWAMSFIAGGNFTESIMKRRDGSWNDLFNA